MSSPSGHLNHRRKSSSPVASKRPSVDTIAEAADIAVDGIVCSDSDLSSILRLNQDQQQQQTPKTSPSRKFSRASSTRRSLTQRLLTVDYLAQEAMGERLNREELFERRMRRISTGSMANNNSNNNGNTSPTSPRSEGRRQRRKTAAGLLRRRNSLSWDTAEGGEEKGMTVDPELIGSVIEDLLKGRKEAEEGENEEAPKRKGSFKQLQRHFSLVPGKRKSSCAAGLAPIPGSPTPTQHQQQRHFRRTRSVDVTAAVAAAAAKRPSPTSTRRKWVIVDEVDRHHQRPRKLSLNSKVSLRTISTSAASTSPRTVNEKDEEEEIGLQQALAELQL